MASVPVILRSPDIRDVIQLSACHAAAWAWAYEGILSTDDLLALRPTTFEAQHRSRFCPVAGNVLQPQHPMIVAAGPIAPSDSEPDAHPRGAEILGFARAGPTRDRAPTGDALSVDLRAEYSAELQAIYILQPFCGTGLGRALMHAIVRRLVDLGHRSMCLWVLEANTRGRRFYERLGGREIPLSRSMITIWGKTYPQVAYGWSDLGPLLSQTAIPFTTGTTTQHPKN